MLYNMYRFEYDSDNNKIISPYSDPVPSELVPIIMAHRFTIVQDCFELLRFRYDGNLFIIQKYLKTPIYVGGVAYHYTLRCS